MPRIIRKLRITEVSAVDRPANNKAVITSVSLVKREAAPKPNEPGGFRKWLGTLLHGEPELLAHIEKVAERQDADPDEGKGKYGDVTFADAKNKKYPLDTEAHVRAALSYWGMPKNRAKYSSDDQKTIGAKIHAAARKLGIGKFDDALNYSLDLWERDGLSFDDVMLVDSAEDIEKELAQHTNIATLISGLEPLSKHGQVAALRDAFGDVLVTMTEEETNEAMEKDVMALSEAAQKLIKELTAEASAAATPEAKPDANPEVSKFEQGMKLIVESGQKVVILKGMDETELEALANGAHSAMAAAGAPPHDVTGGGDDIDTKADAAMDLIKSATGCPEDVRGTILELMKRGKKYSGADGTNLKKAHDLITKIGAKCDMPMGKAADDAAAMRKMLTEVLAEKIAPLQKGIEDRDKVITELHAKVTKLESQPQPLPNGLQLRSVGKDGQVAPYAAPGVTKADENIVAPNGTNVTKIITDARELLPGIQRTHDKGGVGGIEGLMSS